MFELILQNLRDYLTYFQIVTAIVITIYSYKLKTPILKAFVLLFWYSTLNEFIGLYYKTYINTEANQIVYNVYFIVSFTYFLLLFHHYIKSLKFKKFIKIVLVLYFISILIEALVFKKNYFEKSQVIPYIFAGVCILISTLYYYYEILNSKTIIKIEKKTLFWITIAYFFYYLVMVPFKVQQNFYAKSIAYNYLFNIVIIITLLINILLIFGFIWSYEEHKEEN